MLILFDLDGTLLDTREVHGYAARRALTGCGLPSDEESIERFLRACDAQRAGMEEALFLNVWKDMQIHYRDAIDKVHPFPGAREALSRLKGEGHALGVATSKRRWAVDIELRSTGIQDYFAAVVCREDTRKHKPHPQPLLHAQSLLGARGGAYLGDQDTDVAAARAAGMLPLGASWGWDGAAALRAAGCYEVLPDFFALGEALRAAGAANSGEEAAE